MAGEFELSAETAYTRNHSLNTSGQTVTMSWKSFYCAVLILSMPPGPFSLFHHAATADEVPVPIGTTISNLRFTDIRGLKRSLEDLGEFRAVVLTFTTTTCPLVRKSFPKLIDLHTEYGPRGVAFLAVNVGQDDSIREMAAQAVDFEVPFYFVKDTDFSVTRALGVHTTPEVVVLDHMRTIRYRGRIDDQLRIGGTKPAASRNDLAEALRELLHVVPVSVSETPADGCLITIPQTRDTGNRQTTWANHIAALVHQKCSGCHRPGTAAPFPLLSHEDVIANAQMIAEVIRNETMPPWYATHGRGTFQNDASLKSTEQRMLLDWLSGGCPPGDLSAAPQPPEPPASSWRIGEPDTVITMVEEHTVPSTGFVPYRYTVLPFLFLEETWVEAFEIRPLNPAVVHHCNMAYVTKDGAGEETFITGYVPGGQPMDLSHFDNGVAFRIPAGAGLGLQIHYTTTGKEETSRIQVGLRFPRREIRKQVRHFLLDPRGWMIPPRDPAFRLEASHTLDCEACLLGIFTHMHVRGRDMTFFARPLDKPEETLLQIPNYNFEWQLGYELKAGTRIFEKGTQIRAVAHFDNSVFNPYNPDPGATVRYGPQTVDEMFNGFVFYVDNQEQLSIQVNPQTGRRVGSESN